MCLETLLHYQTLVRKLTGLPIADVSLPDTPAGRTRAAFFAITEGYAHLIPAGRMPAAGQTSTFHDGTCQG